MVILPSLDPTPSLNAKIVPVVAGTVVPTPTFTTKVVRFVSFVTMTLLL